MMPAVTGGILRVAQKLTYLDFFYHLLKIKMRFTIHNIRVLYFRCFLMVTVNRCLIWYTVILILLCGSSKMIIFSRS